MTQRKMTNAGRQYGGMSHDDRVAERYRMFIEAGIEVFGKSGFRAGTVRAICAQAGLTDRYFYESFDDSDALLRAVYQQLSDQLLQSVSLALAAPNQGVESKVDGALTAFFSLMRDPRVGRIMLVEIAGASRAAATLFRKSNAVFASLFIEIGTQYVPGFRPGESDGRILGFALVGAVVLAATYWMLGDYKEKMTAVVFNCRKVVVGTMTYSEAR